MIDLKVLFTKILIAVRRLPNFYDPDGGDTSKRPSSANINSDNSGSMIHFLSTGSMTSGKPSNDGNILHFNWDNSGLWASQLFIGHGTAGIQHRTQTAADTWSPWYDVYYRPQEIVDSENLNAKKFTVPGLYYCTTNARAQTLSNCPIDNAFMLEVVPTGRPFRDTNSNQYRMQTLKSYARPDQVFRRYMLSNDGGSTWTISGYGWVQLGYILDRSYYSVSGSKTVNAAQYYDLCTVTLPANTGRWLILSQVASNAGASLELLNALYGSGTGGSLISYQTRVTTSSGQGLPNWGLVTTGSGAYTVGVRSYGYYTTSHTETGRIVAVRL